MSLFITQGHIATDNPTFESNLILHFPSILAENAEKPLKLNFIPPSKKTISIKNQRFSSP